MEQLSSHRTDFYEFLFLSISRKPAGKSTFNENLIRITCTLHEAQYSFMIISCSVLLRIRNVSDKRCRENKNTHFIFNYLFIRKSCLFKIMWKNIVESNRTQMKIWRMCILGYIPKSTNTQPQHTQHLLLFHCNNGCKNASQCYIYTYFDCLASLSTTDPT
jgi:hypothetical protein